MSSFKDSLPASCEVTFLPLLIAYVFFGMGMSLSLYIAMVGPILYCLMCLFFITADLLDGIAIKLLVRKILFIVATVSPAVIITLWRSNMI